MLTERDGSIQPRTGHPAAGIPPPYGAETVLLNIHRRYNDSEFSERLWDQTAFEKH